MSSFDYNSIWKEALEQIEKSKYFSEDTFNNWIRKTTLFKIDNNQAYVSYRSKITYNIVNREKQIFEQELSLVWEKIFLFNLLNFVKWKK